MEVNGTFKDFKDYIELHEVSRLRETSRHLERHQKTSSQLQIFARAQQIAKTSEDLTRIRNFMKLWDWSPREKQQILEVSWDFKSLNIS